MVTKIRITVLLTAIASMLVALVLRLYYLQVLSAESYAEAAESNSVRFIPVEPSRGRVLDRNGQPLIDNRPSNVVSIRREDLSDREATLGRLSQVLGIPVPEIEARLADKRSLPFTATTVAQDVSEDSIAFLREHNQEFPGVATDVKPVRVYPHGRLGAHLLGYTGEITAEQLELPRYQEPYRYRQGSVVGRTGVEHAYELDLRGKDGLIEEIVDARGRVIDEPVLTRKLNTTDPVPGADIVTTIDLNAQALVEGALEAGIARSRSLYDEDRKKNFLAPGGAAVVLNPRNGEVIAMASFPSFDPSAFIGGISNEQFDALNKDPAKPLLNRATQAEFPPGSTFKIVTAAAALGEGIATPGRRYPCPAQVRYFNQTFRNWRGSDSGALSVSEALQESCNTVFQAFGRDFYLRFRSGQGERLQEYARRFGFGARTGIEIPGERPGRVPDAAWLKTMHQRLPAAFPYSEWLPGYTINMAFGQGDLNVTPVQLATAYAAIANGGVVFVPHVASKVMEGEKEVRAIAPQEAGKVPLTGPNLQAIRRGLEAVPVSGTAGGVFAGSPLHSIGVAGKTGSAQLQTRPPKQPFSWFAAYAPAADPQYLVVVMIEEAGAGSQAAAPVTRRILEGLFGFNTYNIAPGPRTD